ncbi:hypothetical protein POM88_005787 [Heracleum sosnowskyi]|uniref:Uncharacterized protein n=1 Tax=Heracleum sosnowskyi TaxID=360622 RepID=A0AAD8J310_9APIA|nr:hypothetical protein POM88_005787 [Heracleum sosnowskyi]
MKLSLRYQLEKAWSENEDLEASSHSQCSDEEDTRREVLHEMRVPTVLREPWSKAENHVKLRSYFVKFRPQPADRDYRPFGLFVQVSLRGEAERMKLDLHLACGRSVETELVLLDGTSSVSTDLPRAKHRSSFIFSASPAGRDTLTNSPKGL